MSDRKVFVHELKARLSEFLGRSLHGEERVIIERRNRPIAMILPMEYPGSGKRGLAAVDWSDFALLAKHVDEAYQGRQDEAYREIPI